ncbi:MAG: tetratricopeptide repeat protein [Spirochaetia bacterium]
MQDIQPNSENENIQKKLLSAYEKMKEAKYTEAINLLDNALSIDFEHCETLSALKCANFWKDRQEQAESIRDLFDKGEYLIAQWDKFESFIEQIGGASDQCVIAIKHSVFGQALQAYEHLIQESGGIDPEIYMRAGRCYKAIGNYEKALECYENAMQQKRDDAGILAELADAYALVNELRFSKAFFREAFYLNPQGIDLSKLESGMIGRLIEKVKERGFTGQEIAEWIPVYGVLFGVFNIKRELRPIELGKLKQSIYALETEVREGRENAGFLKPRLINRYFWLIDHYMAKKEDRKKIEEVLLKLQEIDPAVHRDYTN